MICSRPWLARSPSLPRLRADKIVQILIYRGANVLTGCESSVVPRLMSSGGRGVPRCPPECGFSSRLGRVLVQRKTRKSQENRGPRCRLSCAHKLASDSWHV